MKKAKCFSKMIISVVLLIVIAFCNNAYAYSQNDWYDLPWDLIDQWTDNDSICVTLKSDAHKQFTVEDFPEVDCRRVIMFDKKITDCGFQYEAVLVLDAYGETIVDSALTAILANQYVVKSYKNTDRLQSENRNTELRDVTIKIGQSIKLQALEYEVVYTHTNCFKAVMFKIDNTVLPDDYIDNYSFRRFGINRFLPVNEISNITGIKLGLNGHRSDIQTYWAEDFDQFTHIELANELVNSKYVTDVTLVSESDDICGGYIYKWTAANDNIKVSDIKRDSAVIKGIAPGKTELEYSILNSYDVYADKITVTVSDEYRKGDVNKDASITSADALIALQYSVGKVVLDEESIVYSDVDRYKGVTSTDALYILKFSLMKEANGGLIENYVK